MKLIVNFFLFFLIGCNTTTNKKIDTIKKLSNKAIDLTNIVHKDSLVLNGNEGKWYYKNKLYNGFAVKLYPNKTIKEKTGFFNGKKEGVYKVWFNDGKLKLESHYSQNVLVGTYKSWWNNGNLASEVNYVNGKMNGVERKWFSDGNLSKERNLLKGRENGLQRAWLQNGKIYVNYEAKNGRSFGMKRAKLCYQLKDEKIKEYKK
ncbi:MAG: hypothetical protein ABJH82_07135 [Polaribacter sp.]|uniref:toxin-antitoxin system YwqK family antitoxin n=1 Tax=Polaribacter sp. TaxID=1920175 RepID=UPI0032678595